MKKETYPAWSQFSDLNLAIFPWVQACVPIWQLQCEALRHPWSISIFEIFLVRSTTPPITLSGPLADKASAGDIVMVRHLLDDGADVIGNDTYKGPPLLHSVRSFHEDIVIFYLGAEPTLANGVLVTVARFSQPLLRLGA